MAILALLWLAASAPQAALPADTEPRAAGAPATTEAPPPQLHPGVSLGLGSAYDLLGARLELAADHLGVFVGVGLGFVAAGSTSSAAVWGLSFGARWYREPRAGLFLSANFLYAHSDDYFRYDGGRGSGPTSPSTLFTTGATIGYRFRSGSAYFEAGIGGLVYRTEDAASANYNGIVCCTPAPTWGVFPDLLLGVGLDF